MACCGGIEAHETDLKNLPFEDIYIQVDKSKLKFFADKDKFELVETENMGNQNTAEVQQLSEIIQKLNEESARKDKRIGDLKGKIGEIDKKIEAMMQILNIDTSEKEYIHDLEMKIKQQASVIN